MRGARRGAAWLAVLGAVAVGCGADTALEESGDLGEVALGMQGGGAQGEHGGAEEPWVMCPHRTREAGVDPLGPVIAHGYEEAPGFGRGHALSEAQKHFVSKASLRVRADDGPNTVLWEGLSLPSAAPSDEEIEAWVTGAILLSGKNLPAPVKVARLRRTAADDGAGHALPVLRVWEMQLEHAGVPIAAAHCSLFAEVESVEGALLTCRLPLPLLDDRERFTPYTITKAEAEAIALGAAGATRVVSSAKRYFVSGGQAGAKFVVYTDDGSRNQVVLLSGAGEVENVEPIARHLHFKDGVYLGYQDGNEDVLYAPITIGEGQQWFLDTAPFNEDFEGKEVTSTAGGCDDFATYPAGFVVCGNPAPAEPLLKGVSPGEFNSFVLGPRAPDDDFSAVLPVLVPVADGKMVPGIPAEDSDEDAHKAWRSNKAAPHNAKAHFAELQLFYSVGLLQRRYEVIGHPDFCAMWGEGCPELKGQSPFRLKLNVHDNGDISADLTRMRFSDLRDPSLGYMVEVVADGTIVAHEYQHFILLSIEADPKSGWEVPGPSTCCAPQGCERDALHEGLADAFSSLFTGYGKLAPSAKPMEPITDPCADPLAYPDTPLGELRRSGCNRVRYGYWDTAPDDVSDGLCPFEIHRRGAVIFGALHRFHRMFAEAGFGYAAAGQYLYDAQKELTKPHDDERVYLDALLARLLASTWSKRYRANAQLAFQAKGVFPMAAAGSSCEGCTPHEAKQLSMRVLAIAAPLMHDGDEGLGGPTFELFVPQGSMYDETVTIELSNNPQFQNSGGDVVTSFPVASQHQQTHNKEPLGYLRVSAQGFAWEVVEEKALASDNPRIYYRAKQCLKLDASCVVTAMGSASPYVRVDKKTITSCSHHPAAPGSPLGVVLIGALGLALAARRRSR